ncbi:phosphatase PAP2 family protein [Variovorax sp. J22P240]|uniref:phosphatase PAP2 family protein n=1 Tax=unclassified Variovorax TaxID=663243 RepID=UPI00257711E2|nr:MULTISPECIES: phosphatase PAP2 family protein [unclassified Variovorax]MDL9997564.1 phosphatase PAP2 family protein [Variovorax sp. J22P240]MDM0051600.1 phosphatase PAP2 family protein [Variovorax sp. J22R115]
MQALNISLFQWLAAGHTPHPQLLWIASVIAEGASWACVAIMGWVAWRRPPQRAYAMGTLVAAGVTALIAHALADAINLPRPFALGLSPPHIVHGARGSLPSAHASVMFTVALIFCMRSSLRGAGLAMLAIAVFTGWARVYVGVHFPFDIVAGLILAVAITAVFWALVRLSQRFIIPRLVRDDAPTALRPKGSEKQGVAPTAVRHA